MADEFERVGAVHTATRAALLSSIDMDSVRLDQTRRKRTGRPDEHVSSSCVSSDCSCHKR
jgi:hypothetical protein